VARVRQVRSVLAQYNAYKAIGLENTIQVCHQEEANLAHLEVFGCRAYPLIYGIKYLKKLDPRAHVGYLVGYDSSNIFRVWVPSQKRIIRTRDVEFDSKTFYTPGKIDLGFVDAIEEFVKVEPPLPTLLDGIAESLNDDFSLARSNLVADSSATTLPGSPIPQQPPQSKIPMQLPSPPDTTYGSEPSPTPAPQTELHIEPHTESHEATQSQPPSSPPATRIAPSYYYKTSAESMNVSADLDSANIIAGKRKRVHKLYVSRIDQLLGWLLSYNLALSDTTSVTRTHQNQLPLYPENWNEVLRHPYCDQFIEAAEKEYNDLCRAHTFWFIDNLSLADQSIKPLPLKWVFKYKFDSDGFLIGYKARICVRGDLQTTMEETTATTLAARVFRFLIAIIAAFGLEMRQYDIINAFINATLNEVVYMHHPDGFERTGLIQLNRALYGLR
jgi:hypothetical protein